MVKLHAGRRINLELSNFYLTLVTIDTEVLRKPARQFTIERWVKVLQEKKIRKVSAFPEKK
jgi:hypothetical protein